MKGISQITAGIGFILKYSVYIIAIVEILSFAKDKFETLSSKQIDK